jgi:hypothetical protein
MTERQAAHRHIANGSVRHAYLFCGPPGVGRRSLALRFVQALNCVQPPAPGEACGQCRMCEQTWRMQLPDLHLIQIAEDAQTIKVEQVRELQRLLALAPYQARYRVALLLGFEKATAGAQNALLKTLEEAPEKAILLLTADSPDNLLPTITSRCEVCGCAGENRNPGRSAAGQTDHPGAGCRCARSYRRRTPGMALKLAGTKRTRIVNCGWINYKPLKRRDHRTIQPGG